jgi:ubiquinone/menaquinone biosynthesis C-methylase UbiE
VITQHAYDEWSKTYDTVVNKTRDLEAKAIKIILDKILYEHIVEIGCGTGKNTLWLAHKCRRLTAADFSAEMLQVAKAKFTSSNVTFQQTDITRKWQFNKADLISCSLVLEHIQDLSFIFEQAALTLNNGGQFYICELHPYKQLQGSKARFEKDGNLMELEYFIHHMSEYFACAKQHGFICNDLNEWFDDDDKSQTPRLVSFLFRKL